MLIVVMAKSSLFEYFVNIIVFGKSDDLTFVTTPWLKRYLERKRNTAKIRSIGVIANFLFLYISHFLRYLHHILREEVKLDVSGCRRITRLQTSLV